MRQILGLPLAPLPGGPAIRGAVPCSRAQTRKGTFPMAMPDPKGGAGQGGKKPEAAKPIQAPAPAAKPTTKPAQAQQQQAKPATQPSTPQQPQQPKR